MKQHIPKEVSRITETLQKGGFDAYLVGGCVRDLLMQKSPKDWDITTNALPEQIIDLFEETFYENSFGTVGIVNKELEKNDPAHIVEVTPYRLETEYTDNRRPDAITFSDSLEEPWNLPRGLLLDLPLELPLNLPRGPLLDLPR